MNRKEQIYQLIKDSDLFDPDYYLNEYRSLLPQKCDPIGHFMQIGWKKGMNPSASFDVQAYLERYPDVKKANVNPLVHYLKFGKHEQRSIFEVGQNTGSLKQNPQIMGGADRSSPRRKTEDELDLDHLRPLIESIKSSTFTVQQVESLLDDYYELYFQFEKFKQRPLIRIARYFDRRLPDNKGIQKFISGTLNGYSIVKNEGLKGYFQRRRESRAGKKIRLSTKQLNNNTPVQTDTPIFISQANLDQFIRYYSGNPPVTPDVFIFSRTPWQTRSDRTQGMINTFIGLGHRVFFIEPLFGEHPDPEIIQRQKSTFSLTLPQPGNQQPDGEFILSADSSAFLEAALNNIKLAFSINAAVIVSDYPQLRKLFFRLRDEFGWKLIYDRTDVEIASENAFSVNDDQRLLAGSDLLLASSESSYEQYKQANEHVVLVPKGSFELPEIPADLQEAGSARTGSEFIDGWLESLYPKISVIVVTYNNLELTKQCLDSIQKNTGYPNYEVIVVDNASSDDTVDYLELYQSAHKNFILVKNEDNRGFAGANNQGAKIAAGEYVVFLNNDTIVTPGWLHSLYLHLKTNPNAGMVGPVTNAIGNEAKIDIDYTDSADINYFAAKRAARYAGVSFPIKVLALYCCMISRDLFLRLDGLDEQYRVGMFEDDDLAMKLKQEGLQLLCAEDVFIHHFHGASFNKIENQELQQIFRENRSKFERKWGVEWQPHENRKHS